MSGQAPHDRSPGIGVLNGAPSGGVLVVDDDPATRAWITGALDGEGIPTVGVARGRAALRLVAGNRFRPSVLLTQIDMPEMTGIELAARMLALCPGVRVVMMTADRARAAAARDHPAIVSTVLLKPLAAHDLIETVRNETARPAS
jgi:CheY-like chemotaxis protein